jgi:mannosyltransferase OCH1-like enzyme
MLQSIQNGYKIPNIIHQTFINTNLPIEIVNVISENKKRCPGCKFLFYSDNDCNTFIKENYPEKIYNAYNNINSVYGAMKADFFRYCVLYKLGGIYLDIKSIIKYPIFKLLNKNDICILDLPRKLESWRTTPTYEQWVLIFAPNHPYLLKMINLMTYYIEIKYEPSIGGTTNIDTKQKILNVTGPDAFTKAINMYSSENNNVILHRSIDYYSYFTYSNSDHTKMYSINKKKHYSKYNESLYK